MEKRFEATGKGVSNPNFKKISNAFGINYTEIKKNSDIEKKIKKVLKSKKPEFINILVNPNQKIIPKLSFGDPIEDLSPKIGREEFYKNMIVKPINKKKEIIESN